MKLGRGKLKMSFDKCTLILNVHQKLRPQHTEVSARHKKESPTFAFVHVLHVAVLQKGEAIIP